MTIGITVGRINRWRMKRNNPAATYPNIINPSNPIVAAGRLEFEMSAATKADARMIRMVTQGGLSVRY